MTSYDIEFAKKSIKLTRYLKGIFIMLYLYVILFLIALFDLFYINYIYKFKAYLILIILSSIFYTGYLIYDKRLYIGSDTVNYIYLFQLCKNYSLYEILSWANLKTEFGFLFLTKIITLGTKSPNQYFFLIYILTVGLFIFGIKKYLKNYYMIGILFFFLSPFYFSCSFNIIRQGLSLSIAFWGVYYLFEGKFSRYFFLILLAITIHYSAFLYLSLFIIKSRMSKLKIFICLWLIASIFYIFSISLSANMLSFIFDLRTSYSNYLIQSDNYTTGFKLSFFIFSSAPLIWYFIFSLFQIKFDSFYIKLLSTYLFLNSFYMINSNINYYDRIALISWIFIPIILVYPIRLLKDKVIFCYSYLLSYCFILVGYLYYNNVLSINQLL